MAARGLTGGEAGRGGGGARRRPADSEERRSRWVRVRLRWKRGEESGEPKEGLSKLGKGVDDERARVKCAAESEPGFRNSV